jgi:hypothetical protein
VRVAGPVGTRARKPGAPAAGAGAVRGARGLGHPRSLPPPSAFARMYWHLVVASRVAVVSVRLQRRSPAARPGPGPEATLGHGADLSRQPGTPAWERARPGHAPRPATRKVRGPRHTRLLTARGQGARCLGLRRCPCGLRSLKGPKK